MAAIRRIEEKIGRTTKENHLKKKNKKTKIKIKYKKKMRNSFFSFLSCMFLSPSCLTNKMNIKLELNKLYYKYINTSCVNYYRLLILSEEYRAIGKKYFKKYPKATGWINLNKELFDTNKQAEIDYIDSSEKQANIQKEFFEKREMVCKNCKNKKDSILCSDFFEDFYVSRKYHYGQCIENIVQDIKTDIKRNMVE